MDKIFVSRGGIKLQAAIENFKLKMKQASCFAIENSVVLDVGSSTGGFVDCLLQNGAKRVYAVDTSYGELAWKLRNDPRVVVMERTNVLYLKSLPDQMDIITIDAGWTKLELILPVVKKFLKTNGAIIALLKPQYEADKNLLKRGILPIHEVGKVKEQVFQKILDFEFKILNSIESPILGGGGNREFLLYLSIG
ncbi:TlyA family rRNA (cytidine-2'-O)-methyltransferase [Candidatus Daviesbacteria bacterium]|nr:TlyA family rRNA (cytidine-2'-O)-methyltransferase [Candidatus Daviesbacteria bacterium]